MATLEEKAGLDSSKGEGEMDHAQIWAPSNFMRGGAGVGGLPKQEREHCFMDFPNPTDPRETDERGQCQREKAHAHGIRFYAKRPPPLIDEHRRRPTTPTTSGKRRCPTSNDVRAAAATQSGRAGNKRDTTSGHFIDFQRAARGPTPPHVHATSHTLPQVVCVQMRSVTSTGRDGIMGGHAYYGPMSPAYSRAVTARGAHRACDGLEASSSWRRACLWARMLAYAGGDSHRA